MFNEDNIQSAIKAGIFTEETAAAFLQHIKQARPQSADEEHFRLITGFNDIFVVIASLLLLSSVNWMVGGASNWLGSIASAATAWGLSEFFVRKRRMAFPAIVLLLAFVGYVFSAGFGFVSNLTATVSEYRVYNDPINYILPAILASVAAWLHWQRFKVPITVAAGTAALVVTLITAMLSITVLKPFFLIAMMIAGIAVFLLAMRWDSADKARQTRASDVAFWLHLLAAPLIIHPIFSMLGVLTKDVNMLQALVVLALYVAIGITSLLIDRRALMVSALGYVIYVFSALINSLGSVSLGFGLTSFIIGSALLMLSAYWHQCRARVLVYAPPNIRQYLP